MDGSSWEAAMRALFWLLCVIVPTVVLGVGIFIGWLIWG